MNQANINSLYLNTAKVSDVVISQGKNTYFYYRMWSSGYVELWNSFTTSYANGSWLSIEELYFFDDHNTCIRNDDGSNNATVAFSRMTHNANNPLYGPIEVMFIHPAPNVSNQIAIYVGGSQPFTSGWKQDVFVKVTGYLAA